MGDPLVRRPPRTSGPGRTMPQSRSSPGQCRAPLRRGWGRRGQGHRGASARCSGGPPPIPTRRPATYPQPCAGRGVWRVGRIQSGSEYGRRRWCEPWRRRAIQGGHDRGGVEPRRRRGRAGGWRRRLCGGVGGRRRPVRARPGRKRTPEEPAMAASPGRVSQSACPGGTGAGRGFRWENTDPWTAKHDSYVAVEGGLTH